MTTIQLRRGAAALWTTVNPILKEGEQGYETDTGREKVGDGVTSWDSLPYQPTTFPSFVYGDGSDGAHICVDGEVVTGGFYTNFTIPEGDTVTVYPANRQLVIQCTDTFTIAGALDLTGAPASGLVEGGQGGVAGGAGDPNAGQAPSSNAGGAAGGNGGAGSAGPGGIYVPADVTPGNEQLWRGVFTQLAGVGYNGSSGGAGGTGDATYYGGGGGGGGNSILVVARRIVHAPSNSYLLTGGRGGDGGDDGTGNTGHGDCGSGGGGGDGWWATISDSITGSANIIGGGGQPGTPCGSGTSGLPGGAGFVIHYTPSGVQIVTAT